MRALHEAILSQGIGIGSDIVKVDMFLNHRIDTALLNRMGQEIARHFAAKKPDIVLTVEASGIALAVAAGMHLGGIPVVFAKKSQAVNQSSDLLCAPVYSFTHKQQNMIRADKRYLPSGSRVLIVDDFLANGEAVRGMMDLVKQAGCQLAGVAIAIEKGFQPGGQALRKEGVDLYALAVVDSIQDGHITLREE